MGRRRYISKFIEEARHIMDDNLPIARFNESIRNIEKLKESYQYIKKSNEELIHQNEKLNNLLSIFQQDNYQLRDQIQFLEEIINSLQVIVSIRDVKRKNLLWYNQNYQRLLGYRHKELQELNCKEAIRLYHPEDYKIIKERNKILLDKSRNKFSCTLRLRHINGKWIKMRSDYIVLKRNADGTHLQAIEILSNLQEEG